MFGFGQILPQISVNMLSCVLICEFSCRSQPLRLNSQPSAISFQLSVFFELLEFVVNCVAEIWHRATSYELRVIAYLHCVGTLHCKLCVPALCRYFTPQGIEKQAVSRRSRGFSLIFILRLKSY